MYEYGHILSVLRVFIILEINIKVSLSSYSLSKTASKAFHGKLHHQLISDWCHFDFKWKLLEMENDGHIFQDWHSKPGGGGGGGGGGSR